jgi:beta-phosphoglucomutase family hydrolase
MSSATVPSFGAIFDWDGVIIDSGQLHEESWRRLAKELGQTIAPDSFIRGFGMKSQQVISKVHRWSQKPEEILRLTNRKEELYREILAETAIAPLPGVIDWLSCLRQANIPCAIASSTPRANIEVVLNRLNVKDFFSVVVAAEDVVHGKPNPEVFLKAATRLQLDAVRAVVFEDAYVGIEAAHAAEMLAVAVATTHSQEELRGADLVVKRLDELSVDQITKLLRTRRTQIFT